MTRFSEKTSFSGYSSFGARTSIDSGLTFAGLIGFYAGHRLIIMSHDQLDYQKLGMMIAATTKRDVKEQALSYLSECMNALKIRATR